MSAPAHQVARVHALIQDEPDARGDLVASSATTADGLGRLCRAAVRAIPATGAGVSLMDGDGNPGMGAASDSTSEWIEELQFVLGVGPCLEAFRLRRPVLAPDLSKDTDSRWPQYSSAAQDQGVQAVFAFPLQLGAARLGVLDVYRDTAGPLTLQGLSLALTFAEVALMTVLDGQSRAEDGEAADGLDEALEPRADVYQAQGMVMVQLGVPLAEALVRLRAHAYATERRLVDVARDVVARRMVME